MFEQHTSPALVYCGRSGEVEKRRKGEVEKWYFSFFSMGYTSNIKPHLLLMIN